MQARLPLARARSGRQCRLRRAMIWLVIALVTGTAVFAGVGYQLFYREHQDDLRRADAIVVLGGDHDGREQYGVALARAGIAHTVVFSNPYLDDSPNDKSGYYLRQLCNSGSRGIEVICFTPEPSTTRGEAMYVAHLAKQRGWRSVVVISWRYHLVRARYIFAQCFSGDVIMRSVPRDYDQSPSAWGMQFAYQDAGLVKAAILGCAK